MLLLAKIHQSRPQFNCPLPKNPTAIPSPPKNLPEPIIPPPIIKKNHNYARNSWKMGIAHTSKNANLPTDCTN